MIERHNRKPHVIFDEFITESTRFKMGAFWSQYPWLINSGCACVGQASRLTSKDLRSRAGRPRYIPEAKTRRDFDFKPVDSKKSREA
jgi:hypothetical protein